MTHTFEPDWLALRERTDHRSRAAGLIPPLRDWWGAAPRSTVLDLASGTGANLRYLAPELPGAQAWTLLDHDPGLLELVPPPPPGATVESVRGDLAGEGLARVAAADLVTASALLDLVSEAWLGALVDACADAERAALFALTYDGTIEWGRSEPEDDVIRAAVNEHQRRDKGLGPALGPSAADRAEELLRRRSYRTLCLPSPWRLGPRDADLASALVDGWARAASEQRPSLADSVRRWARRRAREVAGGDFSLVVGHRDLLALPAERTRS